MTNTKLSQPFIQIVKIFCIFIHVFVLVSCYRQSDKSSAVLLAHEDEAQWLSSSMERAGPQQSSPDWPHVNSRRWYPSSRFDAHWHRLPREVRFEPTRFDKDLPTAGPEQNTRPHIISQEHVILDRHSNVWNRHHTFSPPENLILLQPAPRTAEGERQT